MSACLQRIFAGVPRGRVGVGCDVCPRQLTAVERRPPLALVRWQRVGAVPGRAGAAIPGATRDRVLYWRDCYLRFACMTSSSLHRASAACCAGLTGLIAIFWGRGRPGWLRHPHNAGT
jgi:hypothetical protein